MEEYKKDVKADLLEVIKDNPEQWAELSVDDYREQLSDYTLTDTITGNGSGSYTFNSYEAQEIINSRGLIWDDEFIQALEEYGASLSDIVEKGPEAVDVWARCIALESLSDEELEAIRDEALSEK